MSALVILDRASIQDLRDLRKQVRRQNAVGPFMRRGPRDVVSNEIVGIHRGIVTAHNGAASQNRLYHVTSIDNPSIEVRFERPIFQQYDTATLVHPAEENTPGILVNFPETNGDDRWYIGWVEDEYFVTATCSESSGAGTPDSLFAVTEISRDGVNHRTKIVLAEKSMMVALGSANKLTIGQYTFPAKVITLHSAVFDGLAVTAATNTNQLEVGMGTTASSGTGTSLSGTEEDWVSGATTSAIPFSLSPVRVVDVTSDGRSAAEEIHLNMAPKTTWTASENVTISAGGIITLSWRAISY